MSLVIDNRAALNGAPGLHAVIIGISAYPNLPGSGDPLTANSFGMRKLSSPALSAFKIFQWLIAPETRLPVPLATCRLFLLPSIEELAAEPQLRNFDPQWAANEQASLDEVLRAAKDWRTDARARSDGMTFFYFAGHGVQRTAGDAVLLLPGFGSGIGGTLRHAIDTSNLRSGMAPSSEWTQIAQTQLYFVDACRILPEEFRKFERMSTTEVFDVELPGRDDRRAPVFYAAIPGTVALGLRGNQTIFSRALIDCLRGLGAEAMEEDEQGQVSWRVSVYSLDRALAQSIAELNNKFGVSQEYDIGGSLKNTIICNLDGPPLVNLHVQLDPPRAAQFGALRVEDFQGSPVWSIAPPLNPHPCVNQLPAGVYTVSVDFQPAHEPFNRFRRSKQLLPPRVAITAKV